MEEEGGSKNNDRKLAPLGVYNRRIQIVPLVRPMLLIPLKDFRCAANPICTSAPTPEPEEDRNGRRRRIQKQRQKACTVGRLQSPDSNTISLLLYKNEPSINPTAREMSGSRATTRMMSPGDLEKEIKAFDESKAGVKGLVDSGTVSTISGIFFDPPDSYPLHRCHPIPASSVPVIDLSGLDSGRREEVVAQVRQAAEKWGFFQVVGHGIPQSLLDDMISSVLRFNESPREEKVEFYTRDLSRRVLFVSTSDIYVRKRANWRDTMHSHTAPELPRPDELPAPLSVAVVFQAYEYAWGDSSTGVCRGSVPTHNYHLIDMECMKAQTLSLHYYPVCPQPELTHGASKHSDPSFFTVLLQDSIGGLQALHHGGWVDVNPVHGALVVNIGDLLQLLSNGKLASVEHRVLASGVGPRASVACFFKGTGTEPSERRYGPIQELVGDGNPPKYKHITMKEFYIHFFRKGIDGISFLDAFKAS